MRRYSPGPRTQQVNYARLIPTSTGLAFESSYDRDMVAEFKAIIPSSARRWDAEAKRWIVDPQYGQTCADLAFTYLSVRVQVPQISTQKRHDTRLLKIEYLGTCKERDNQSVAFGWADGGWHVIFPETVLRDWFSAGDIDNSARTPGEQITFYGVLSVPKTATVDQIRSSYRRLARQWHPDVCKEPGASAQFIAIQRAYEVLSDDLKRRKYDAGLSLQDSIKTQQPIGWYDRARAWQPQQAQTGYRSPLRCGWILAEGTEYLGRFNISKIQAWEDVTDDRGRTMVTSWPSGATTFEVNWV